MATNTNEVEYLITSCPNHGVKVVGNFESFKFYVDLANDCATVGPHADAHRADGSDCWVCCPSMVIDPHGMLDY